MVQVAFTHHVKATALIEKSILPQATALRSRVGLPKVQKPAVPRTRLAERLSAAADGPLTVITAPVGAGKTTGVALWARNLRSSANVTWVDLHNGSVPDGLPAIVSGWPSVVILDGFPVRPSDQLCEYLELLLCQFESQQNVILISSGLPAIPTIHFGGSDLVKIGFDDLVMDENEVELLLCQYGVRTTEAMVQAVLERTAGWAYGVRVAAQSVKEQGSVDAALVITNEQVCKFLDAEIISRIAPAAREMLITTSVADEVPAACAHAVAAEAVDGLLNSLEGYDGFIDLRTDGSFRCHPLVRRTALARLSRRAPSAVKSAYRQVAQWHADQRDTGTAVELAIKGDDWEWAGRALVESLAVPRILAGAADNVAQHVVEVPELGESEPLLLAAAALARSWPDIAESAISRATSELAQSPHPKLADELSLALLRTAMCYQRGDGRAGASETAQVCKLAAKLSISERARTPELSPLIDYYAAAFELLTGDLPTARFALERGAGPLSRVVNGDTNEAEKRIRADCAGLLSWLDAFCGDLRRATWYSTSLLTGRRADSGERGVTLAHLATAWAHLERGEVEQARQRLDHALSTSAGSYEPLLAVTRLLTQVRLARVTGEPEIALRLLRSAGSIDSGIRDGWFADQFVVASAEAYLVAGEAQQAISTLTPWPDLADAQARVVRARGLLQAGDLLSAEEVISQIPSNSAAISLVTQIQYWLLQAELAIAQGYEQGDAERARLFVDHALRAATREELRAAVGPADTWLQTFVERDSALRRHSAFLASLPRAGSPLVHHELGDATVPDALFVVPLTTRETDVLRLLAQFCSNDEIAADLVVSMNTVKTHMRSLFQKLSVTRRADAVRRGRALGLC